MISKKTYSTLLLLLSFVVLAIGQPANDNCSGAITLTVGTSCSYTTYNNTGATASTGAPAPGCGSYSTADVWFKVVVPASGKLIFDSQAGTLTDCGMAIYSGSCASLTLIECDDDDSNNGAMPMINSTGLTPGSTIYIRFWDYGGTDFGTFGICVYDPPATTNDECITAIPVTVGTSCNYTTYSNVGATSSSGAPAPGCASYSTGDVWFSAVVPADGHLVFDSQTGSLTDCGMAVYSGTCSSLTLIECDDDDSNNGSMPMLNLSSLTPGSTVYIRFWDYGGTDFGTFGLCVYNPVPSCTDGIQNQGETGIDCGGPCTACPVIPPCVSNPAAGDNCGSPTPICNFNGYCGNTSSTYTVDSPGNLGTVFCGSIDNNSWLSFTADATTATLNIFVSNCTNNWGIQMQIYTTSDCNTFTSVSNCWNPGVMENGTITATGLTIGQTYYLMIDGYAGDVCDYVISAGDGVMTIDAGPDVSICGGQSTNLSASGGTTYHWSPTTGLSNANIFNPTATPSTTTTYTVSVTGGNPSCPSTMTDQVTVTVNSSTPTAGSNSPVCSGQTINLTSTPASATSYSWSGPGGFTSNLQNPSITSATPSNSGIYTVTVTNSGCTGTASVNISVGASATVTATATPSVICPGATSTISASGANTYTWSPSGSGSSFTTSPSSTTVYNVTGTTSSGCTGSTTVTLTVNALPTVSASASPGTICIGSPSSLTASGASTYSWSNSMSGSPISVSPTSTTTYSVTGTNAAGCTASANVTVNVSSVLSISVNAAPTSICSGQNTTLTANGATNYSWNDLTSANPRTVAPSTTTTYSVTGSDLMGCTGTSTITVTVNPVPTVTASATQPTICSGVATTLSASGANTYTWSPSGSGSSFTANPSSTTTYNVTGTTSAGCSATSSILITVNPNPVISASASPAAVCNGQSSIITSSGGATYTWSPSGSGNSFTATPGVTTTYLVTGTSASGCSGTSSVTLTVNPLPTITATASPAAVCLGQSSTIAVSGGSTYSWSPTGSGTSFTSSPSATTTYTVTGTSAAGCSNTGSVTLTINPLPTVTASATQTTLCNGVSTTISASGANSYTWSPSGSGSSFTAVPSSTVTYNVTGTSLVGCTGTSSILITVNSNPVVTAAASPNAICLGQSSTVSSGGASIYTWSPSGSGNSFSANPSATTTYLVTGTSASGCSGTASVILTVNPIPTITATATPSAICIGQNSTITATGGNTYSWSPIGSGNSFIASPSTTTIYNVTGTSTAGCSNTGNVTLTVNPLPIVSISMSDMDICPGGSCTISGNGANAYSWMPSGSGNSFIASPSATTVYTVTGTSAQGCTNTANSTLTVYSNPVVVATASPSAVCIGFSSTISGSGAQTYVWDNGNNNSSFNESPANTTTYQVTGTDINGCTSTSQVTLTLMPGLSVAVNPATTTVCQGVTATLTASSPGSGVTYSWDSGFNGNPLNVAPVSMTTYVVTGTDVQGCSGTANAIVNVSPIPVPLFTANPLQGCIPLNVLFTDLSTGASGYTWYFGDGATSNSSGPQHTYQNEGLFDVRLVVTNPDGCKDSLTLNDLVQAMNNPIAGFNPNPEVVSVDDPTVTFIDQSTGATFWDYYFSYNEGPLTYFASVQSPTAVLPGEGQYSVLQVVTNAMGCIDSTRMFVEVKPVYTFFLPNSFTPNGDGKNDVYKPYGTGWDIDTYSMKVFDRWGEVLFSTTDINVGWDGTTPDGKPIQETGIYTVHLIVTAANGIQYDYIESVTLLR